MTQTAPLLQEPRVLIVVPAYNEACTIFAVVNALLAQAHCTSALNVVVVDNESTDHTAEFARQAGATVVKCARGASIAAIRNTGVSAVISELQPAIIGFIDGDCVPCQQWLSHGIAMLRDLTVGAVGGPCDLPPHPSWIERCYVGSLCETADDQDVANLAASSFITRCAVFESVGGFREDLNTGEDDDLSSRIRSAGLRLRSSYSCRVFHYGYPKTVRDFYSRERWHGGSQVKAAEFLFTPMLVACHAFFLSVVTVAIVFILAGFLDIASSRLPTISALAGSAMVLIPASYAMLKIGRGDGKLRRFPGLVLLMFLYFFARAHALIEYYWRQAFGFMLHSK